MKGFDNMKKVLLVSVLLGGLMVGCSQAEKPSIEELQETIKEQEQYITELEKYKKEQENFERQARQMQKQLDYEEEQANIEKYYMALSDITVISKNIDDSTSFHFDYGDGYLMTLAGKHSKYISELAQYETTDYSFTVPYSIIKSGNTFKMSEKDLDYFLIYGEYEEITINEN